MARRQRLSLGGSVGLVALSSALLVLGLVGYASSLPALTAPVPEPASSTSTLPEAPTQEDGNPEISSEEAPGEKDEPTSAEGALATGDASGPDDAQAAVPEATTPEDVPSEDPSSADPLTPTDPADSQPSAPADEAPAGSESVPEPETPAEPAPEDPQLSQDDDPFTKVPTEAEESRTRAALAPLASAAPGYKSQVDACAASFSADQHADLSVRLSHQRVCASLSSQLWDNYYTVRDSIIVSNNSRYKSDQEKLIAMYRCLAEYLGTYESAWARNVAYDDPAGHEADYLAPVNSDGAGEQNVHLQEYYRWKTGLSL